MAFTVLAEPLTLILGGARYIPDGAIALRLMIWSIPIGWMNSLTQYTLVSLGQQRPVTRAFAAAVVFNVAANFIFIPAYGFQAAALATIASELVLFAPFIVLARGKLDDVRVLSLLWRPLAALALMLLVVFALGGSILALIVGGAVLCGDAAAAASAGCGGGRGAAAAAAGGRAGDVGCALGCGWQTPSPGPLPQQAREGETLSFGRGA